MPVFVARKTRKTQPAWPVWPWLLILARLVWLLLLALVRPVVGGEPHPPRRKLDLPGLRAVESSAGIALFGQPPGAEPGQPQGLRRAGKSAGEKPAGRPLDIRVLEGGWGDAGTADIRAVCLSAATAIWQHVPKRRAEPITVRHSDKGPMVVYGTGPDGERRVLLNVQGAYWAQFSYQFAHEMCHILANYREARNPQLWFEESLAETASLFALRSMAASWKTRPPYPNWKSYSASLADYAADRIQATPLRDGMTLAGWYRREAAALEKTGTDRARNQVVAAALLPLFEKAPASWAAVGYLNQWDPAQPPSFPAYLADWYRRVPEEHRPFVAEVARQFEIDVPVNGKGE